MSEVRECTCPTLEHVSEVRAGYPRQHIWIDNTILTFDLQFRFVQILNIIQGTPILLRPFKECSQVIVKAKTNRLVSKLVALR